MPDFQFHECPSQMLFFLFAYFFKHFNFMNPPIFKYLEKTNYRIAEKFGEFTGYEYLTRKSLANA